MKEKKLHEERLCLGAEEETRAVTERGADRPTSVEGRGERYFLRL